MAVAMRTNRQIGDILVDQGLITPIQLDEALQRQRLTGDMLGRILVSLGHCKEQDIIDWTITDSDGMEEGNFVGRFLEAR